MELSDRKKKILEIVIDDFIADGKAISSKAISEKNMLNLSSATIRNELSNLEELGFLGHLHTSSGRVPLAKAYRYYVENLLSNTSIEDFEKLEYNFCKHFSKTELLIKDIAKTISDMTNYTTATEISVNNSEKIEDLKLVKLKSNSLLLIILTENEILKDNILIYDNEINENYLDNATTILKELFIGKSILDVSMIDENAISTALNKYRELFQNVLRSLKDYILTQRNIILEGESNIFKHSEFNDIEMTKDFLSVISSKQNLAKLLYNEDEIEFSVKIGKDESNMLPKDCAIVSAEFLVGGKKLSTGVIGPLRMDYKKVIDVLKSVKQTLTRIQNSNKENKDE